MNDFEAFRSRLDDVVYASEQESAETVAARRLRLAGFLERADDFARDADQLRVDVIDPRIEYVEALFPNAVRPDGTGHDPRRIRLHFGRTDEFPCMAEVTIDVAHAPEPGCRTVSVDYVILPAHVTDGHRGTARRTLPDGVEGEADVVALLDDSITDFVRRYLETRSPAG